MTTAKLYAPASQRRDHYASGRWLVVIGIILVSVNLRPAVTSLGAMLQGVRSDLGMGGLLAGLLTALPVVCFAIFGASAPALGRRVGMHRLVLLGMCAIVVGLTARVFAVGSGIFVAASVVSLMGIAVANVILPVLIKHHFPSRIGLMTGVYSTSMAVGTAVPAAITVPVAQALGYGWRGGLAVWVACAAVAVLPWVLVQRRHVSPDAPGQGGQGAADHGGDGAAGTAGAAGGARLRLVRSPTAWGIAGFFGMQSLSAYSIMGWLPQIYRDAGASAELAGYLLSFATMLAIPIALVLPTAAARRRNQSPFVFALVSAGIAGYLGLLIAPGAFPWLWALLLGLLNCAFPLALTMIGLRGRNAASVAQLSGFAQGIGYTVAAVGPLGVGALHEVFGSWNAPLALLLGCVVLELAAGLIAARNRYVDDEAGRAATTAAAVSPATGTEAPATRVESGHEAGTVCATGCGCQDMGRVSHPATRPDKRPASRPRRHPAMIRKGPTRPASRR